MFDALNVATALAVTIPLLFALASLHDRNQQQALDFNLLSLADSGRATGACPFLRRSPGLVRATANQSLHEILLFGLALSCYQKLHIVFIISCGI